MTKYLFSIIHLCHINFYKSTIKELKKRGHTVEIAYLNRGKIKSVLEKELPGFNIVKIGDYSPSTPGKLKMVIQRFFAFNLYFIRSKPEVVTGVGDFMVAFVARFWFRIFSLMFTDDYEFRPNYVLCKIFGNKFFVPKSIFDPSKRVHHYPSFKELAYLHPDLYHPNVSYLKSLKLTPNDYIFVREVANFSMNYAALADCQLLSTIRYLYTKNIQVVLSLEDKSKEHLYRPYCIILEEPVEDIYSIVSYASLCISSGDSVAREAAFLGVPAIYTGPRDMFVNRPFIQWGGIFWMQEEDQILSKINVLLDSNYKSQWSVRNTEIVQKELMNTSHFLLQEFESCSVKNDRSKF